ncbi:MAG: GNAT family N-acetyltransferase [Candidatus Tectomicrobia bacterium]|nr:GNAT family N-acetyltransferase [Candidatus Tectomicrobia bacterium]
MTIFCCKQPPHERAEAIARRDPCNPFLTPAYQAAKGRLGIPSWLLQSVEQNGDTTSAFAYVKQRYVYQSMAIESIPPLVPDSAFARELAMLCRRERVVALSLGSFASRKSVPLPLFGQVMTHQKRVEHIIDLRSHHGLSALSINLRRNIKKAEKSGVSFERTNAVADCINHVSLMDASIKRQRERGEAIPTYHALAWVNALVEQGAADLFQVRQGNKVLSSLLILLSARGAYYQSAGTAPEGMACGASPFLVYRVIEFLRQQGFDEFNLGGATPSSSGLYRFKTAFGGYERHVEAADVYVGTRWRQRVFNIARKSKAILSR